MILLSLQRPVSSLRSHFERITHGHPAEALKREAQDHPLRSETSASGSRLSQRLSLDGPKPIPFSSQLNTFESQESRHDAIESDRPVSSQPLIVGHNTPPSVAIHSPSPSTSVIKDEPFASVQISTSSQAARHDKNARLAGTKLGPIPNRATKPKVPTQSSRRPTFRSNASESEVGSGTVPISSPSPTSRGTQSRVEAEDSITMNRVSPFSTPPSSDESVNSYPVNRETPKVIPFSPTQPAEIRSPENSVIESHHVTQHVHGNRSPRPPQGSAMKIASIAQFNRPVGSTPNQPPELPPRADKTSRMPSTPQSHSRHGTYGPQLSHSPRTIGPHNIGHTSQTRFPPPEDRKLTPNETITGQLSQTNNTYSSVEMPKQPLSSIDRGPYPNSVAVKDGNFPDEYMDGSNSSRRPPWAKTGSHVIHTNYDSKLFDMCAGHACCVGQLLRVWDLLSGKVVLSLAIGEKEVKATASAFKPGSKSAEEGSRLWIGTNYGDLQEVDTITHKVVSSNLSVHSGREIVRIHRYQNAMWTLDEEGTLLVWPPGDDGLPTLESRPKTCKVPRGHIFSIVVGGLLWFATRKDVRVFRPSADEHGQFEIEQQPYGQPGVGDVTSGAVIENQLDKIYFGHSDGKISIYSTTNFACLGIMNASGYKINCLVGAGSHLWAGYNSGKICVYDTQTKPWKVIKDYHAHEGPVISLSVDRSSLWMSGQLRVGSLSLDNTIRLWDGLLEDHWLESELRDNDTSWCNFEEIEALVMTWNAGASTPASLRYGESDPNLLRIILPTGKAPDLLIFGFQELVDLEDKRLTASV
ncbi:MAG: hypothetical protein Q9171_004377 [Xanthocarpia ochracea]